MHGPEHELAYVEVVAQVDAVLRVDARLRARPGLELSSLGLRHRGPWSTGAWRRTAVRSKQMRSCSSINSTQPPARMVLECEAVKL